MKYKIRETSKKDSKIVLEFIKELASYEQLEDQVLGTIEDIENTLFCENPKIEALISTSNLGQRL
jgi:hypothetical protein